MVIASSIFHTALNYSVKIDKKYLASRVAEKRLEELNSWSRNNHGTNGELEFKDGWDQFDDITTEDEESPGFRIVTNVESRELLSPSSTFETVYFSSQEDINLDPSANPTERQRTIEGSARLVRATAIWGELPSERLTLSTLIADPGKDYGWNEADLDNAVEITVEGGGSIPNSLGKDGSTTLVATIKDVDGNKVNNPAIEWYIDPDSTGRGTLRSRPRYPDRVRFVNVVRIDTNPALPENHPNKYIDHYGGGSVRIVARARLGGIDVTNSTPPINLVGDVD